MAGLDVAVVGATGAVGEIFLTLLTERQFPLGQLYPLASEDSVGKTVRCQNRTFTIDAADDFDFSCVQLAFFSAGSDVAKRLVPKAVAAGCRVIDNSSAFRGVAEVPLVVPEINADAMFVNGPAKMVANPNCATIPFCLVCAPLMAHYGIASAEVVTFQSVSGSGRSGVSRLASESISVLNGHPVADHASGPYRERIAFNVVPFIDQMGDNGFTAEEMKLFYETKKIFDAPHFHVNSTTVRVPVFYGHSEVVTVRLHRPFELSDVQALLKETVGVAWVDEATQALTPLSHGVDQDPVYVSRLRRSLTDDQSLSFWLVSDNLRKGAALNAIQIAERLFTDMCDTPTSPQQEHAIVT